MQFIATPLLIPVSVALVAGVLTTMTAIMLWLLSRKDTHVETVNRLLTLYESQVVKLTDELTLARASIETATRKVNSMKVELDRLNLTVIDLTERVDALRDQVTSLGHDPIR